MTILTSNGLTEEQWVFVRAVAGEVDGLRARVAELEAELARTNAEQIKDRNHTIYRYRTALQDIIANEEAYSRGEDLSAYIAKTALSR